MTKLERCQDYYRKLDFLKNKEVPIQTEIKLRIGLDLSNRIFETPDPVVKKLTGVEPLQGPGDELWVSPSDYLINYVRLRPPLTSKYIKALTHQGILEIGTGIEEKFIKKVQDKALLQLKSLEEMLRYLAKRDVNQAIKCTEQQLKSQFSKYLEELDKKFEQKLKNALDEQREKMGSAQEEAVLQAKTEVAQMMQFKIEQLIAVMVKKLISQYGQILEQQSEKWHNHFKHHMKLAEEHLEETLEKKRDQYKDRLRELHADLQSDFIANMMYIICSERRKCECEKKEILEREAAKILSLKEELEETKQKLKEVELESSIRSKHISSREVALYDIIKQFQKFIYFVLRASPTQAEYLLDIEKLMIFELTKSTMERQPEMFKGASLLDLTKRASQQSARSSYEVGGEGAFDDEDYFNLLKVPDYHACDNVQRVDHSAHTLSDSQDLPAFRYGSKIFIREDFRNMISQGLVISKSNEHWNWDVEDLTNLLTKSHGTCLKDPDVEKFPCLASDDTTVCPSPGSKSGPKSPQRIFHETCTSPCEEDGVKFPKDTNNICDETCVKEADEMPCEDCYGNDMPKSVNKSDSTVGSECKQDTEKKPCQYCALMRQGDFPNNVEVVCDCFPNVEKPSLTEIKEMTEHLILESKQSTILSKKPSDIIPLPKLKSVPIHLATDSQEILRLSIHKKLLERKREEREKTQKKSLTMETKVKPITVGPPTVKPVKISISKIGTTRDSVELIKAHSQMSTTERIWTKQRDKAESKASSDSAIMHYQTLGQMTNYLEKLKRYSVKSRNSTISNAVQMDAQSNQVANIYSSSIHRHSDKKSGAFVHDESVSFVQKIQLSSKESKVVPHLDDRVKSLITDIKDNTELRSLFLGTR